MRCALLLAAAVTAVACGQPDEAPRNLLLVTADAVRTDRIHGSLAEGEETGRRFFTNDLWMKALADTGAEFPGCYTTSPGTLAAAASILTGRYPRDLGFPGPSQPVSAAVPTLAEVLGAAGFETRAVVSTFALRPDLGLERGFDEYVYRPDGRALTEDYEVVRDARHWLMEPERHERPWFLWVHLRGAHGPVFIEEDPYFSRRPFLGRTIQHAKPRRMQLLADNSGRGGVPAYQAAMGSIIQSDYVFRYDVRTYITDWFLSELRYTLVSSEQRGRTVVCFTGTHGEGLGEHAVYFNHGENLFDEVLAVPLLLRVPGRGPERREGIVSHVDLFPTLTRALGVDAPADLRGQDLFGADAPRGWAFSELYPPQGPNFQAALTTADWKLIQRPDVAPRLHDRANDAAEREDLGANPPVGARPLLETLSTLVPQDHPPAEPLTLKGRDRALLEALGYVSARLPR